LWVKRGRRADETPKRPFPASSLFKWSQEARHQWLTPVITLATWETEIGKVVFWG
jgi:hypothetical protein